MVISEGKLHPSSLPLWRLKYQSSTSRGASDVCWKNLLRRNSEQASNRLNKSKWYLAPTVRPTSPMGSWEKFLVEELLDDHGHTHTRGARLLTLCCLRRSICGFVRRNNLRCTSTPTASERISSIDVLMTSFYVLLCDYSDTQEVIQPGVD